MDVSIHGDGIKITESLENYTRSKVDKLDRYLPNISRVGVELAIIRTHRGADLAIAQITVQHARGAILRAEEKLNIEKSRYDSLGDQQGGGQAAPADRPLQAEARFPQ